MASPIAESSRDSCRKTETEHGEDEKRSGHVLSVGTAGRAVKCSILLAQCRQEQFNRARFNNPKTSDIMSVRGEPGRIRTFDRLIKSQMLYQLSYGLSRKRKLGERAARNLVTAMVLVKVRGVVTGCSRGKIA